MTETEKTRIMRECRWPHVTGSEIDKINEEWNKVVAGYKAMENLYANSKDFREYVEKDCQAYGYKVVDSLRMAHVKEYARYLVDKM